MFAGIFKSLSKKVEEATQAFSGNKDFLEAVCAAGTLSAFADGEASDKELSTAKKAVQANKLLGSFSQATIESTMNTMIQRAEGGRMGRAGLWEEIDDVAKNPEMARAVVLAALDVAEGEGGIGDSEQKFLNTLSTRLRVDLKAIMAM